MYMFISLVSMDADGLLSDFTISTFGVTASLLLLLELSRGSSCMSTWLARDPKKCKG